MKKANAIISILLTAFMFVACNVGTVNPAKSSLPSPLPSATPVASPKLSPTAAPNLSPSPSTTAGTNQGMNKGEKNIGVEITPPEGWEPVEGSFLPIHYLKNTASFLIVDNNSGQPADLDTNVRNANEALGSIFEDVVFEKESEKTTVDGRDARRSVFTCKIGDLAMKFEYVYLIVNGTFYTITFGDTKDTFDTLSGDFAKILEDIRFT